MRSSGANVKLWLAAAVIVAAVSFMINFVFGDSGFVAALIWSALSGGVAIGILCVWYAMRLARVFDWAARHSPLRRMPKTLAIVITAATLFIIFGVTSVILLFYLDKPPDEPSITYSGFVNKVKQSGIDEYIVLEQKKNLYNIRIIAWFIDLSDGQKKWAYFDHAPASIPVHSPESWLYARGYEVELRDSFALSSVLMQSFQAMVMSVPFFFFLWLIGGGGLRTMGEELSTLQASKRLLAKKVTYKDVAGIDPVIKSLERYKDYLSDPKRYRKFGGKLPKGILLDGLPGVGKSHVAKAFAGETGLPTFIVSGSDFHFALVGVGAARAEKLFEHAIRNAPSILIIDEIDSAGGKRGGADLGGAGRERDALVNKLNSLLDRISAEDIPVIVFGTTNLVEALDSALFRAGRFDTKIYVPPPDSRGREAILGVYLDVNNPEQALLGEDVDLSDIVRRTKGWTGSGLAGLANEARNMAASNRSREKIHQEDLLNAWEFVLLGPQTRLDLSEDEYERVSYHEGGHAIASLILPEADPSEYVTMKTHGGFLGHALPIAERDYHLESKTRWLTRVKVALAGYAVEIARYGEPSTGAGADLEKATNFAKSMVFVYGMDEEIGPVAIDVLDQGSGPARFGGGQSLLTSRGHERVQAILNDCVSEMTMFFSSPEGKEVLENAAQALRAEKTLTRAQLEEIVPKEMLERRTAKP